MTKKKTSISCDWRTGATLKGKKPPKENKSALYKHEANSDGRGLRLRNINKATETGQILQDIL